MQCQVTALVGLCRKEVIDTSRFIFALILDSHNPFINLVSFCRNAPCLANHLFLSSTPVSVFFLKFHPLACCAGSGPATMSGDWPGACYAHDVRESGILSPYSLFPFIIMYS